MQMIANGYESNREVEVPEGFVADAAPTIMEARHTLTVLHEVLTLIC